MVCGGRGEEDGEGGEVVGKPAVQVTWLQHYMKQSIFDVMCALSTNTTIKFKENLTKRSKTTWRLVCCRGVHLGGCHPNTTSVLLVASPLVHNNSNNM